MAIQASCSHCGKKVQVPDSFAGRRGKCPSCGQVIEIPARPGAGGEAAATAKSPAEPAPARPAGDPMADLARALEGVAKAGPAAEPPAPAKGVPQAAPAVPLMVEPSPRPDSDELIAVPPVGVQTPSGLRTPQRRAIAQTYRWQRKLAGAARTIGFVLGMLSVLLGTGILLLMALQGGRTLLAPGLALFVLMVIQGAVLALGGLLARHVLLLLADLSEDARRKQELLDQMSERLE